MATSPINPGNQPFGNSPNLWQSLFPTPENTTTNASGTSSSNTQTILDTLSKLLATQQQTVSPEIQDLINKAAQVYGQQLNQQTNLQPYVAQQTQGINDQARLSSEAVNNIMAARGLAQSPVAATSQVGVENQRQGAITNLKESIPLLQQQLLSQTLGGAQGLIGTAPRGATSSQEGSTNQFGNTGTTSQFQQQQQTQKQTGTNIGGVIGGLSGILGLLFP